MKVPSRRAALLAGLAAIATGPAAARAETSSWLADQLYRAYRLKPLEAGEEVIRAFWQSGEYGSQHWLLEARRDSIRGPLLRFAQATGSVNLGRYRLIRRHDLTTGMSVADYQPMREACVGILQEWLASPRETEVGAVCRDPCGEGTEFSGIPGVPPMATTSSTVALAIREKILPAATPYITT